MTKASKTFQPLPRDCFGKPWTVETLKALDSSTMRRILRLYGADAVNKQLRMNAHTGREK